MNKNKYYPTYTINPESIYGSGIVLANKFPHTDTTTSVITDSFPKNKNITPPLYHSGVSKKPLDTNGYRVLKNKNDNNKMDTYYYPTQQTNKNVIPKIKPTLKEKIKKKIKNFANGVSENKNNKDDKNNDVINDNEIDIDNSDDNDIDEVMNDIKNDNFERSIFDKYGRNKKMWMNDHYLYSLEPRYNSVVYPWRAYTWMYPVAPNSDNYYIDNINGLPNEPIIVSNDSTKRLNWQGTYLASNMLKENFENDDLDSVNTKNMCFQNYNVIYFVIIVLIISIYFYKE